MKKKSRRQEGEGGLNITSMMDMMTIILCFLLKSYSTEDVTVKASEELQIPTSTSLAPIKTAVNLVVTDNQILVDGDKILSLDHEQNDAGQIVAVVPESQKKGQLISDLYDVLLEKAEEAKEIAAKTGLKEAEFKGQILLQCHRTLPFTLIREVMYTAGQAQFGEFKFVVIKGG